MFPRLWSLRIVSCEVRLHQYLGLASISTIHSPPVISNHWHHLISTSCLFYNINNIILFFTADPKFSGPINNVTTPVGRDATLTCIVHDLMSFKVGKLKTCTHFNFTSRNHLSSVPDIFVIVLLILRSHSLTSWVVWDIVEKLLLWNLGSSNKRECFTDVISIHHLWSCLKLTLYMKLVTHNTDPTLSPSFDEYIKLFW